MSFSSNVRYFIFTKKRVFIYLEIWSSIIRDILVILKKNVEPPDLIQFSTNNFFIETELCNRVIQFNPTQSCGSTSDSVV